MSDDAWHGRALRLDWAVDALPDGAGSRLLRDVRAELDLSERPPGPAAWHAAVLRASAWAPPERPLVACSEPRLTRFTMEADADPALLIVDLTVAPTLLRPLPPAWRASDGLVAVAPDETTFLTRVTLARGVGDTLRTRPVDLSPTGVRAALQAVIAEVDALVASALAHFAGPAR